MKGVPHDVIDLCGSDDDGVDLGASHHAAQHRQNEAQPRSRASGSRKTSENLPGSSKHVAMAAQSVIGSGARQSNLKHSRSKVHTLSPPDSKKLKSDAASSCMSGPATGSRPPIAVVADTALSVSASCSAVAVQNLPFERASPRESQKQEQEEVKLQQQQQHQQQRSRESLAQKMLHSMLCTHGLSHSQTAASLEHLELSSLRKFGDNGLSGNGLYVDERLLKCIKEMIRNHGDRDVSQVY